MIQDEDRQIPFKKYKEQLYNESTTQYFVPYNMSNHGCIVISTNLRTLGKWLRVDCNKVFDSAILVCEPLDYHSRYTTVDITILQRQTIECHSCK